MSKFNVGDYVQIRYDLQEGKWYNHAVCITKDMMEYKGMIFKIEDILDDDVYFLENDKDKYFWTDDMLIGLGGEVEETKKAGKEVEKTFKQLHNDTMKRLEEIANRKELDRNLIKLLNEKINLLDREVREKQKELSRMKELIEIINRRC